MPLPTIAVAFLRSRRRASCAKARDEPGYRSTDIDTAVSYAYNCLMRPCLLQAPARRPAWEEARR
jgi:hypothetical protein